MCYVIANGNGMNKLYLTRIERAMCARWDATEFGRLVYHAQKLPDPHEERAAGIQVVGHYNSDAAKARKFRSKNKAEQVIKENHVLRFCHVEEVMG